LEWVNHIKKGVACQEETRNLNDDYDEMLHKSKVSINHDFRKLSSEKGMRASSASSHFDAVPRINDY
jgi:hypothetical protein